MAILVDNRSKVLVQGITGHQGQYHTNAMLNFGTNVVGGVTPGKGGQEVHGKPVFNTMQEAVDATGANSTCVLVPRKFALGAVMDAINAGIQLHDPVVRGVGHPDIAVIGIEGCGSGPVEPADHGYSLPIICQLNDAVAIVIGHPDKSPGLPGRCCNLL